MKPPIKTPVAAQRLNVPYYRLISLLRLRKIAPPTKDSSGDYLWTQNDLEAARRALSSSRRKEGNS
jgi:hypothetical protein